MLARLSLGTIALCLGAGAAIADPLADCSRGANAAVRLRACTAVIDGTAYGAEEKALAYRNRGNARADAGASMQAVSDFSQAIRLRPDDASGYAGRARARLALRDFDGAIADYGEALRLAPSSPAHYTARGHAYFVKGDTKAAIADFDEALRLNPISPSTLNRRGLAYRRAGDLERAIDDYTAALALNPDLRARLQQPRLCSRGAGPQGRRRSPISRRRCPARSLVDRRQGGLEAAGRPGRVVHRERAAGRRRARRWSRRIAAACHAVGAKGASPNDKAPEFRNLHARHPNLALREPLSRGHRRAARRDAEIHAVRTRDRYHRRLHQQPGVGADWTRR